MQKVINLIVLTFSILVLPVLSKNIRSENEGPESEDMDPVSISLFAAVTGAAVFVWDILKTIFGLN